MRTRLALWMVGLCTLTTGCQLFTTAAHNLTNETRLATTAAVEHHRYKNIAREQWELIRQASPDQSFSEDYAAGFKESFADYLEFGGSGNPPFLPPHHYWGPRYRSPEGYKAIEDWFAGFRHGSAAAQASGMRQWTTLPSSMSTSGPNDAAANGAPPIVSDANAPPAAIEAAPDALRSGAAKGTATYLPSAAPRPKATLPSAYELPRIQDKKDHPDTKQKPAELPTLPPENNGRPGTRSDAGSRTSKPSGSVSPVEAAGPGNGSQHPAAFGKPCFLNDVFPKTTVEDAPVQNNSTRPRITASTSESLTAPPPATPAAIGFQGIHFTQ